MTQYGEFGCILLCLYNYAFKIFHFLYKHNDIVSVEGSLIILYIECMFRGHVLLRICLRVEQFDES